MDDLFDPPGTPWQRLSPKYLTQKLILIPLGWLFFFAFPAVPVFLWAPEWARWAFVALVVVVLAWRLIRAPRVFRRWGYAERDEYVYLTHGLWMRNLQCVPYGRMQLVQVQSGPLDRLFGLATVQMITSSTTGTVAIPGLPADDAAALRDRLIARGEQQQAGI